jgi:CspA family cold shock protein
MATGTVLWIDPKKGYGFIARNDGGADVFVHVTAMLAGRTLYEGDMVSFDVTTGRGGKQQAANVRAIT